MPRPHFTVCNFAEQCNECSATIKANDLMMVVYRLEPSYSQNHLRRKVLCHACGLLLLETE
jgi:hypothetical protein